MESLWNRVEKPKFENLEGDKACEVLIIGGGICGILCAYELTKAGVDCIVAEKGRIANGVTNATTAKVTSQHGLIYDKILRRYGLERAQMYYQSQRRAFEKIKSLAQSADFISCDSVVYSLGDRAAIECELAALQRIGAKAEYVYHTELPFDVVGGVKLKDQAHFHPLKFVYNVVKDLRIYENTEVLDLNGDAVITNRGRIRAKKIIVATHFPMFNGHGSYFVKMYQHRSYVLALKNAESIRDVYVDEAIDGLSFRNYNGLLLLGGGSHRTGKQGGGWKTLEAVAKKHYPKSDIVCRWATQDCMTLDGIPYIGQYSMLTPNLYVATGFNKWGMTSSMVSAMLLTDLISGRQNDFADLYSPSRSILHKQLLVNFGESLKGLLTPTAPRCTHLGCALHYNKSEHSWDCACHGSRFDIEGNVLNNPAKKEIKKDHH